MKTPQSAFITLYTPPKQQVDPRIFPDQWSFIPPEWRRAYNVSNSLELASRRNAPANQERWRQRLTAKRRRVQKSVSFGQATINASRSEEIPTTEVVREETVPLTDKVNKPMAIARFFEGPCFLCQSNGATKPCGHDLASLVTLNSDWNASCYGTAERLLCVLPAMGVTFQRFRADLTKILATLQTGKPAVLDYKVSLKIKHEYPDVEYNFANLRFEDTGRMISTVQGIKRYRDEVVGPAGRLDAAVRTIQRAVRRRIIKKITDE